MTQNTQNIRKWKLRIGIDKKNKQNERCDDREKMNKKMGEERKHNRFEMRYT